MCNVFLSVYRIHSQTHFSLRSFTLNYCNYSVNRILLPVAKFGKSVSLVRLRGRWDTVKGELPDKSSTGPTTPWWNVTFSTPDWSWGRLIRSLEFCLRESLPESFEGRKTSVIRESGVKEESGVGWRDWSARFSCIWVRFAFCDIWERKNAGKNGRR